MQEAISWDQRCQQQDDETLSNSDSKMSWSWPDNAHTTISSELSSLTLAVRSKNCWRCSFQRKCWKKFAAYEKNNNNNFNSSGRTTSGIERRIYFLDFLWDQKPTIEFFLVRLIFGSRPYFATEKPKNRKNGPPLLFFLFNKIKDDKRRRIGNWLKFIFFLVQWPKIALIESSNKYWFHSNSTNFCWVSGCCTAVKLAPRNRNVAGSNPSGCWAFFSFCPLSDVFLNQFP